jgi:cellobiose phosphorylase
MDEDGGDLLSPNVLYVLVITEGLFGIEPRSFDRFACTPRLPADWPAMQLQNICLMGRKVDLAVTRTGREITLTVLRSGKTVFRQAGEEEITFDVDLSNVDR